MSCLVPILVEILMFVWFELDATDLTVHEVAGHCLILSPCSCLAPGKGLSAISLKQGCAFLMKCSLTTFYPVKTFHAIQTWDMW